MAKLPLEAIVAAAAWIAGLYTLAVAVFCLWTGVAAGGADVVLLNLFLIPWIAAPALAVTGCAASSSTRGWAAAFLAIEIIFVATTLFVAVSVFFFSDSALDGLAILLLPFGQLALLVAFVLAASLLGWRERPE